MRAKTAALVIGLVFIVVGLLGFTNNPIIGDSDRAIFHADTVHNMVHIISGLLFALVALTTLRYIYTFFMLFGIVYLLLGVIGFFSIGAEGLGRVLGFLHVNGADNFLHVALGVIILATGIALRRTIPPPTVS
jgi:hypothetical protein